MTGITIHTQYCTQANEWLSMAPLGVINVEEVWDAPILGRPFHVLQGKLLEYSFTEEGITYMFKQPDATIDREVRRAIDWKNIGPELAIELTPDMLCIILRAAGWRRKVYAVIRFTKPSQYLE